MQSQKRNGSVSGKSMSHFGWKKISVVLAVLTAPVKGIFCHCYIICQNPGRCGGQVMTAEVKDAENIKNWFSL